MDAAPGAWNFALKAAGLYDPQTGVVSIRDYFLRVVRCFCCGPQRIPFSKPVIPPPTRACARRGHTSKHAFLPFAGHVVGRRSYELHVCDTVYFGLKKVTPYTSVCDSFKSAVRRTGAQVTIEIAIYRSSYRTR